MGKFKEKIRGFMIGRYGMDQLYYVLLVFCLVLMIGNIFLKSPLVSILSWVLLICMIWRTFSRNIYKRRRENEKLLWICSRIKAWFTLTFRRLREIKTRRFRKCPHCKAVVRLPRKAGKHTVQCPCCVRDFEVHIIV